MTELNTVNTDPELAAQAWELAQARYLGTLRMKWQPVQPTGVQGTENKSRLRVR